MPLSTPQPTPGPRRSRYFRTPPGESEPLSPLERDVLSLRAQGSRNAEIAAILCYSTRTIRTAGYTASKKLGTHSMAASVLAAMAQGQISRLLRRADRHEP